MSVVLKRMVLVSALIGASAVGAVAEAQDAVLEELILASRLVPSDVSVGVLLPPGYGDSSEAYPLLLFLHGGGRDSSFLGRLRALIEQAWARNEIPKMVVATPSAGRSFYMDYYDESQKWETFIMTELLDHLRKQYRVGVGAANTLVGGLSMGGMGALRLAFKYPSQFGVVAAMAPAIEPAFSFDEIDPSDRSYRRDAVYWEKFGKPVDRQYWRDNHPPSIAQDNLAAIQASGLQIYLEVGDVDRFNLFRGTELLHRLLFDGGVKHEHRLVRGADHVGASFPGRFSNALRFIGRALRAAE